MSQRPVLFLGGLTGRIYVATRYEDDIAIEKFDVTAQFVELARRLGWSPPEDDVVTDVESSGD